MMICGRSHNIPRAAKQINLRPQPDTVPQLRRDPNTNHINVTLTRHLRARRPLWNHPPRKRDRGTPISGHLVTAETRLADDTRIGDGANAVTLLPLSHHPDT